VQQRGRVGDHAIARARLSRAPRRLSLIHNIVSVAPTAAPSERWVMLFSRAPPSTHCCCVVIIIVVVVVVVVVVIVLKTGLVRE